MPERMTINLTSEISQEVLNVSASVGKDGVNSEGDVLLVQALFWEVLPHKYNIPHHILPLPTGAFDPKTASLIKKYQKLNKREKVSKDGLINKAFGQTVHGSKRPWTILKLNYDLFEIHLLRGLNGDPIQRLMDRFTGLNLFVMA